MLPVIQKTLLTFWRASKLLYWIKSYGNFADLVDFAYWWSCIGKGLRLRPAEQACYCCSKAKINHLWYIWSSPSSAVELMNVLSWSSLHPVLCVKLSFHANLQQAECLQAQDAVLLALLLPRLLPPDLFLLVSALHASTVLWPTTDGELKSLDLLSIFIIYFLHISLQLPSPVQCALCSSWSLNNGLSHEKYHEHGEPCLC